MIARSEVRQWLPAAVVFDCDGLLVDSEPCWSVAQREVFARRGRGFTPREKSMLIGKSLAAASDILTVEFEEHDGNSRLQQELTELVLHAIASGAAPMPGLRALLAAIGTDVPMAIVSNSPAAILAATLEQSGLGDMTSIRVSGDEGIRPKPAADLYLEACERLCVTPSSAIAFEDSATGMAAAVAAGVPTVVVPSLSFTTNEAFRVYERLDDPALLLWASQWASADGWKC